LPAKARRSGVQPAESGADDHHFGVVRAFQRRPRAENIGATVGVITGDMLLGLLKHLAPHEIYFL
jgi:hypothetical protein